MTDNTTLNPGTGGDVVAMDDIATGVAAGAKVQRVKVGFGSDGAYEDASSSNGIPVAGSGELMETLQAMRMAMEAMTRTFGMMMPDTTGRMRVSLDATTGTLTIGTVTSISALASLSNQVQLGGFSANDQIPALMRLSADALRRNIVVS